jgi:2-dehydropantoate 2-reductase
MKIAVIGCGAMGSIYAALLAEAGGEVFVVDSGSDNVRMINQRGLRVEGISGDRIIRLAAYTVVPPIAVDLVIVAVKAAQVEGVASNLGPLLTPKTVVLTIQNGVGSADILASRALSDRLAVGIAGGFGAIRRGPGHVFHNGMNIVRMGAYAGLPMEEVERVAALWRDAGFKAETVSNVLAMQWEKLICNVAYSAPCALTGMTVGEVMDDPDLAPVSRAAATEAWVVAQALNIGIKVDDPVKLAREFGAGVRNAKPSLLQDHENRRPSEIDVINGAVTRAAARLGIAAPVNSLLVALVKQRERAFANTPSTK